MVLLNHAASCCGLRLSAICRFAQGNEGSVVHQLLDEVLSTALERALEPQLLEGLVLERIMGAHNKA